MTLKRPLLSSGDRKREVQGAWHHRMAEVVCWDRLQRFGRQWWLTTQPAFLGCFAARRRSWRYLLPLLAFWEPGAILTATMTTGEFDLAWYCSLLDFVMLFVLSRMDITSCFPDIVFLIVETPWLLLVWSGSVDVTVFKGPESFLNSLYWVVLTKAAIGVHSSVLCWHAVAYSLALYFNPCYLGNCDLFRVALTLTMVAVFAAVNELQLLSLLNQHSDQLASNQRLLDLATDGTGAVSRCSRRISKVSAALAKTFDHQLQVDQCVEEMIVHADRCKCDALFEEEPRELFVTCQTPQKEFEVKFVPYHVGGDEVVFFVQVFGEPRPQHHAAMPQDSATNGYTFIDFDPSLCGDATSSLGLSSTTAKTTLCTASTTISQGTTGQGSVMPQGRKDWQKPQGFFVQGSDSEEVWESRTDAGSSKKLPPLMPGGITADCVKRQQEGVGPPRRRRPGRRCGTQQLLVPGLNPTTLGTIHNHLMDFGRKINIVQTRCCPLHSACALMESALRAERFTACSMISACTIGRVWQCGLCGSLCNPEPELVEEEDMLCFICESVAPPVTANNRDHQGSDTAERSML